jgi:glycosyltransferase involved in cell wall biosynthesis
MLFQHHHVKQFVKQERIDIVHIEAPPFPRVTSAISICSVHDLRFFYEPLWRIRSSKGIYQRLLLKRQLKKATGVATLGPWAAAEVSARLGVPMSRVLQIPPIVIPRSDLGEGAPEVMAGEFIFVLGHLERRKNVSTVIRAAASPHWPKHVGIVIAGADAGEATALRALAGDAKCRVQFLGKIDEATKWGLLGQAELVLVPSLLEGFGIVAVEAPLAGTPAIVSDQAALLDLAGDSRAVVPALDSNAWAERVAWLISDKLTRQQLLEAQLDSAQRFIPTTIMPKLLEIYEQLLTK